MFARKLISPKPCRPTLSEIACVGVPRTECSFVCDFIALEIKESELASHHDNFCKFPVPQPRPQGLLLDDFQNGGSSGEDPGKGWVTWYKISKNLGDFYHVTF